MTVDHDSWFQDARAVACGKESLMKHPEEDRLQKVATILEAMVSDDEVSESMADAMGCVSAIFHESRGTALDYALSLVKERAKELDIKLRDFEWPEDKTVNRVISDVALRRMLPQKY